MGDLLENVSDVVLKSDSFNQLEFTVNEKIERHQVRGLVNTITQIKKLLESQNSTTLSSIVENNGKQCLGNVSILRDQLFGLKSELVGEFESYLSEERRQNLVSNRSAGLAVNKVQSELAAFELSETMHDVCESFVGVVGGFKQHLRMIGGLGILLSPLREDGYFVSVKKAELIFGSGFLAAHQRTDVSPNDSDLPTNRGGVQNLDNTPAFLASIPKLAEAISALFTDLKSSLSAMGFEASEACEDALRIDRDQLKDVFVEKLEALTPGGWKSPPPVSSPDEIRLRVSFENKMIFLEGKKLSCLVKPDNHLKLLTCLTEDRNRGRLIRLESIVDFHADNFNEEVDEVKMSKRISALRIFLHKHSESWVRGFSITDAKKEGGYCLKVVPPE